MTLETILRTVLHAAALAALVAFCGVVSVVGVCSMLRLLCHALAETGRRCGKFVAMMLASLALVCAVVGGGKALNGPPDGVSAPARVMSAPRLSAQRSATAPETCLQGPANAPETLPPHLAALGSAANAQDVPQWELRGAHDDAVRIPAVGWDFRTPDGFVEGMTIFSRGELRPKVGRPYFPRPFTNDLSLLPRSRWGLLPGGGESKLWYAATPSNSLLVTWVNGLVDRNPLTPTNFQAEFFPDGSYEYRYGAATLPREPVTLPFDWDGDGLENTVDPEPETAGPDAHNANDEWYGIVCSGVFERIERDGSPQVVWRDDASPDAYYFVDVVVDHGPVPIYFNALNDGGDLGSPVVVATGGATNHVPLLLGVTYAVTSDVPVTVSLPEGCFAAVATNDALNLTVSWPLEYWFMEMGEGSHAYYVGFSPRDPGGVFRWSWERDAGTGGASLMGGAPDWLPRCFFAVGGYVWADCDGNCGCGGCQAEGTYRYAGRTITVSGGDCGCVPHPPPPPEPVPPSVSVSFSAPAIIYEDAYDDTPTNHVPRRSSDPVTLTVDASGGTYGTTLTLTPSNMGRLRWVSGNGLSFGSRNIPKNEIVQLTAIYDAQSPSAAENDITLQATVEDRVNGGTITSSATTMVVRVELKAMDTAPANPCANRHTFGVYELVDLIHKPSTSSIEWTLQGGGGTEDSVEGYAGPDIGGGYTLRCPLYDNGATLKVSCGGVEYFPTVRFVEPQGVEARNAVGLKGVYPTNICGASMELYMYVTPMTVSFGQIAIEEIPSEELLFDPSTCSGYFMDDSSGRRSHTYEMGAGRWHGVRSADNFIAKDTVATGMLLAVDRDGTMSWYIPMGWHRRGAVQEGERHLPFREFAPYTYWQDFFVFENGDAMVQKHGHWCWRNLQNDVWLDGREVQ